MYQFSDVLSPWMGSIPSTSIPRICFAAAIRRRLSTLWRETPTSVPLLRRKILQDRAERGRDPRRRGCTQVPRIFCEINYHKGLDTGELKQYTLTILPGFLIPYSTVPVDPVHQALESYISEGGLTQVGAAMRMGCLSPASFRLFYCRVRKRVYRWTGLLIQLVVTLGGNVREEAPNAMNHNGVQAYWGWFVLLSAEYLSVYSRLPNTKVIPQTFVWQYLYAVFSRDHMGLGP